MGQQGRAPKYDDIASIRVRRGFLGRLVVQVRRWQHCYPLPPPAPGTAPTHVGRWVDADADDLSLVAQIMGVMDGASL